VALGLKAASPHPTLATFIERWRLAPQLASGLVHLHSLGITHCDIKASNVLLKPNERHALGHAALADFGLAATADSPYWGPGTVRYTAPEVGTCMGADAEPHTPESDVYSFGLMLWELIHTKMVLGHLNGIQALVRRAVDPVGSQPPFGQHGPPEACAAPTPSSSMGETLSSNYTAKVGGDFTGEDREWMPWTEMTPAQSAASEAVPYTSREGGEIRGDGHHPASSATPVGVAAQHAHGPALQGVQWERIVELVGQCWALEVEVRPSAVHLEAQLRASIEAIVRRGNE